MRPTDLKFRSPKEKTPDPYDAHVTSYGKPLFEHKQKQKSSFPQAKRFPMSRDDKLDFWRGPGSYDLSYESIGKKKLKSIPLYKPMHRGKDLTQNAYFYIGSNLVYDPTVVLNRKAKNTVCANERKCKSRPTTASSKNYSPVLKKLTIQHNVDDKFNRPASALGF
ncbi:hypothetical protein SteCoe_36758 [Stentor coeruleus]|uniref:Uncharacterized protein n=1 Tax=Stentor coeruleus TaxID=5963 RepID=A0A1R2APF1_9CILI|nr:hypothetical protein SteCoe_36758 [Stentor coeruleus]